jgi:tetratricopeptide (TPR) repeat protein
VITPKEEVASCEALVPNIEDLRKLGLGQANIAWNEARKALVLGNIQDAHRSLCESSLIHAEGLGVEGLVELLLSKHATGQAASWMAIAKKARPDRRKTLDLEGDVLNQQGKIDEARVAWATALSVKADDEKATKNIGDHYETEGDTFLKSENWAKAEIMFRRAAALNPKSAGAAAGLARTLLAQGYAEQAKLWSDTALNLQPDLGLALVVRADLTLLAGEQAKAVELYRQALKTDPGNPRAHQQIFRLTEQK